jgi:plastocyanin
VRPLPVVLLALSILLASCGGDDGDEGGGGGGAVTAEARQGLRVAGDEYKFDPSEVVVTGGGPLRITLENKGSLAHNLKVLRGDDDLGGTPTFQGGETRSGSVRLEPGRYRMVCTVGNHEELGMTGELEVR